jgi:DUF1365 family protein
MRLHVKKGVVALSTVLSLLVSPAHAYLDPGTGTVLLNAIIAGLVGAGVTVKIYWEKLRLWFEKCFRSK